MEFNEKRYYVVFRVGGVRSVLLFFFFKVALRVENRRQLWTESFLRSFLLQTLLLMFSAHPTTHFVGNQKN